MAKEIEIPQPRKPVGPGRLALRIFGLAVALLIVWHIIEWFTVSSSRIEVGAATTVLTAPLDAQGVPDYRAALNAEYGRGATPADNVAVALLDAFGPDVLPKDKAVRADVLALLGVAEPPAGGDYFTDVASAARILEKGTATEPASDEAVKETADSINRDLDAALLDPWTAGDHPLLAAWLEMNRAHLPAIQSASRRGRFFWPLIPDDLSPGSADGQPADPRYWNMVPDAGWALVADAMLQIGRGQAAPAIDDLLAAHRLARLQGQDPTQLGRFIALLLRWRAARGVTCLAQRELLDGPTARSLLASLNALDELPPMASIVDHGQRLVVLRSLIAQSHRETWCDWNAILRRTNGYFDQLVAAGRIADYPERAKAFEELLSRQPPGVGGGAVFKSLVARLVLTGPTLRQTLSGGYAYMLFAQAFGPNVVGVSRADEQARMADMVSRLALSLAAYKADHGGYPDALAALAPDYVPAVPADWFVNQPLHYAREGAGYLLYSVGANMTDDGGQMDVVRRDQKDDKGPNRDDIAVRVAPAAASQPAAEIAGDQETTTAPAR
ncbi:MAG: hypothetical protein BIFFINMI_02883 [Phycisphaerae bacterium]|nr:hypothetical protein [Phycisphaerae bacterium]